MYSNQCLLHPCHSIDHWIYIWLEASFGSISFPTITDLGGNTSNTDDDWICQRWSEGCGGRREGNVI